jgi:hypothetical protein
MSKVYEGRRDGRRCTVTVREGESVRPLDPRYDVRNHSPDGSNWVYAGSGPAQLALGILLDAIPEDQDAAAGLYQHFKLHWIATLHEDAWTISRDQVLGWLARLPAQLRVRARQRAEAIREAESQREKEGA